MNSIKFNGKEVEGSFARGALLFLGILASLIVVGFVLFLVLPYIGLVVSGTVGIVLVVVLGLIPFAIVKKFSTKIWGSGLT